ELLDRVDERERAGVGEPGAGEGRAPSLAGEAAERADERVEEDGGGREHERDDARRGPGQVAVPLLSRRDRGAVAGPGEIPQLVDGERGGRDERSAAKEVGTPLHRRPSMAAPAGAGAALGGQGRGAPSGDAA